MKIVKKYIYLSSLFFISFSGVQGQLTRQNEAEQFSNVHEAAVKEFGINPLLRIGIYYEDFYYNAKGHPFLLDNQYHSGSLEYQNVRYDNLKLKFDIFDKQLLILHEDGSENLQNYLSTEFIGAFSINGMKFRKLSMDDHDPSFFQIIEDGNEIMCCYQWYKTRSESREGEFKNFVFSESKLKRYLLINDVFYKYHNNRTFLKSFPVDLRVIIKSHLRSNSIKVDRAGDLIMSELIQYCQETFDLSKQTR